MAGFRDPLQKIKTPEALKRALARARGPRKKIVFTNGVFDILHRGHVTYLQHARKLGATLVVALNEDASVRRLKGPERPMNALADRLLVMASLECVDYVTFFGEETDTPLELIRMLRPDVLVKGGDWKVKDIVGSDDVIGWGGAAKSLPFVDGYSTTKLVELIRKKR